MARGVKMAVFLVVAIARMVEAVNASETSLSLCRTIGCNIA
jgi:hypothetical protein